MVIATSFVILIDRNRIDSLPEAEVTRGEVLDRQGRELARSFEMESFWADPSRIINVEETSAQLAPLIEADPNALAARLRDAQKKGRKFAWLARRLNQESASRIRALNLGGVYSLREPKRFYPNGSLASHVIGFVGLDNYGLAGIEQVYDELLSGNSDRDSVTRVSEQRERDLNNQGQHGATVVLTIDTAFQFRTEEALSYAIERSRARSGVAVALDPRTGEILSLASIPMFDPNDPGAVDPEARVNQAVATIFEPGSPFKIVPFSAAIDKGLAKPSDVVDCQKGAVRVADQIVHDHRSFGSMTVSNAYAKSSHVAAVKMSLLVGNDSMYDYMTRFGFGHRTGVELPGETPGLLRNVERWQPSLIGSLAIGQGIGVSAMQMVSSFGTLANDGIRLTPHLVREVRANNGTIVYRASPEQRRVVKTSTAQAMRDMFGTITLNGTAKHAEINFYKAAVKAGTAMKVDPKTRSYSQTKYVSSFVGFAPVDSPAVAIIVVIDEPEVEYGGRGTSVSESAFREIAELILPELSVEPEATSKTAELISPMLDMAATFLLVQDNAHQFNEPREVMFVPRSGPQGQKGERREKNNIMMSAVSNRAHLTRGLNEGVLQSMGRAPPYIIQECVRTLSVPLCS